MCIRMIVLHFTIRIESKRERERERVLWILWKIPSQINAKLNWSRMILPSPNICIDIDSRICITETLDNLAGRLVGQPDLRQNDRRAKTIRLPRSRKCEHSLSCGQRACARAIWTRHTWPRRQDGVESENQFSVAKQWALTQTGNVPTELETKEKKKCWGISFGRSTFAACIWCSDGVMKTFALFI